MRTLTQKEFGFTTYCFVKLQIFTLQDATRFAIHARILYIRYVLKNFITTGRYY